MILLLQRYHLVSRLWNIKDINPSMSPSQNPEYSHWGLAKHLWKPVKSSSLDSSRVTISTDENLKIFPKQEKSIDLLSFEKKPNIDEIRDEEGSYYALFGKAYENGEAQDQVHYLEKLGDLFLQKEEYVKASHLLNSALALATKCEFDPAYQSQLLSKLERIEENFLGSFGIKPKAEHEGYLQGYRDQLKEIRLQIQKMVEEKESPQKIQKITTEYFQKLLVDLITHSIEVLGENPPTPLCSSSFWFYGQRRNVSLLRCGIWISFGR